MKLLLANGEKLFHADDLANLWDIQNPNTLRVTLRRYVEGGLLFRIYRGFYSVVPVSGLDSFELGAKAIHDYCYLTAESVLFEAGFINQHIDCHTFVGKKSLKFEIGPNKYVCRQLKDDFLFNSFGVEKVGNILRANTVRAAVDMLYFNPFYHFDRAFDWDEIKKMQMFLGFPLTLSRFKNSK